MEGFGRRLENERDKKELSKREVSRMLGYSENVFGNYEREEDRPPLETLEKIAELFNVSIDYLVTGKEYSLSTEHNAQYKYYQEIHELCNKHNICKPYLLNIENWKA